MIVLYLTADFGRDLDLVDGGGAYELVMIDRYLIVADLLWDSLWRLWLMDNSGIVNECDNATVGRAAYL